LEGIANGLPEKVIRKQINIVLQPYPLGFVQQTPPHETHGKDRYGWDQKEDQKKDEIGRDEQIGE
jgi:hypothetical protein